MATFDSGQPRRRYAWVAALTCIVVAVVTLADLDRTPPGLYIDEVAPALTARSLAETGRDLLGQRWPLYPLVFPDSVHPVPVNPVWVYSSLPFARLGPSAWSARLPAVLWLWVAGVGLGWCALEVTRNRVVALFAGATAALTPWLFVPGRVAWSIITFPALTALAVASLLRWHRTRKPATLVLSGVLFGLSIYTYSTAKLLVPLTTGAALLVFATQLDLRRRLWPLIPTLAAMALPLAVYMVQHPGNLTWRFQTDGIWHDTSGALNVAGLFLSNYADYLSLDFLFFQGDANLRHGTGHGQLLWIWAPLILMGLWQLWRRRSESQVLFVVAGLLIAPTAAAVTASDPSANRSVTAVVFWAIVASVGLQALLETRRRPRWLLPGLVLLAVINIGVFLTDYFGDYRNRAFSHFDMGKGEVLQHAFAIRGERDLYVQDPLLLHDTRMCVFIPYWGKVPVADWLTYGLDTHGIRDWTGAASPGSLVLFSRVAEEGDGTMLQPLPSSRIPPGGRRVWAVEHSGRTLYVLHEY